MSISTQEYKERRQKLVEKTKAHHKEEGAIVLFAGFEHDVYRFRQESSFYYLTGIKEPGVVLWLDLTGHATILIPNHGSTRSTWVKGSLEITPEKAQAAGVQAIEHLGLPCDSYQIFPYFKQEHHHHLIERLKKAVNNKHKIYTLNPSTQYGYVEQRFILERLSSFVSGLSQQAVDISSFVAQLRRKKSKQEIDVLFRAIDITISGHEAAAHIIEPGKFEYQVQAAIEYVFTDSGALRPAFPSIVGSGMNSTILHYTQNDKQIEKGDLVVVDIGAEYDYYCADLTRTYPATGRFTKRQKEIYNIVLETQEHVASLAKPGMWISHKDHPEQSLNHHAKTYLQSQGYDKYFPHGIGHFLGLDVHDVGDSTQPLEEGDVITIEPGIYIREEKLGVRIEDDYWIVKNGAVSLSEDLPKSVDEIEEMVIEANRDIST